MNFAEYQKQASKFAVYPERLYPFLGLAEEVGELVGLVAKGERGDYPFESLGSHGKRSEALMKEAGDVLWQLSQCLEELDLSMQVVAEMNLKKLEDRQQRGVLKGSGDNR